jgi:hypothetical protein
MELTLPPYSEGYDEMGEEQKMVTKTNRDAKLVKAYLLLRTLKNNQRLCQLLSTLLRVSLISLRITSTRN